MRFNFLIPPSGKIPAHDPKSLTPQEGCPFQRMRGGGGRTDTRPGFVPVEVAGREDHGTDVESAEKARMPTQVILEAGKSTLDSCEIEKAQEIPVQGMETPAPKQLY